MRPPLLRYFSALQQHYGETGWWPGETPFEIAVGAILTQNTAWTNVEKAISNLHARNLMAPSAILDADQPTVEDALRPSGFFRVKTRRLRSFCSYLVDRYEGDFENMAHVETDTLRDELLNVHGVGPETADDILLYACDRPIFVVDAYTRRVLSRHGQGAPDIDYESLRSHIEAALDPDVETYREYHAYFVLTGKDFCRSKPDCEGCPLAPYLPGGGPL